MESYVGNEALIREGMGNPNDEEIQVTSFEGMFPNVARIASFYTLSKDLKELNEEIIKHLCGITKNPGGLANEPGLLKRFGHLMTFAMEFDR